MSRATYENQNKRWCIRYFMLDENGKRIEKKIRKVDTVFPTLPTRKQKARQKEMSETAARLELAGMGGESPKRTPQRETAKDYFFNLICKTERTLANGGNLAGILTTAARAKGVREALGIVRSFQGWLEAHASAVELGGITPAHAMDYAQAMRAQNLSRSTIRHHLSRLSWLFKQQLVKGKIKRNPFDEQKEILSFVQRADETFNRKKITPAQCRTLLQNLISRKAGIKDDRIAFQAFAMLYFGAVTGWRQGDLINKTWRDIDYQNGTIYNLHRKTKGENACESTLPLTDLGKRILTILDGMNGGGLHCRRMYTAQDNARAESVDGGKYKYIFRFSHKEFLTAPEGETDKEREAREAFNENRNARAFHHVSKLVFACFNQDERKDIVQGGKNKMTRTSFHSLRKTVISYLFGEGIQESIILKMVGHADKTVEQKHYQDFGIEHYAEAVELLENAFILPVFADGVDRQEIYEEFSALYSLAHDRRRPRLNRIEDKIRHYNLEKLLPEKYGVTIEDLLLYFRVKERQERRKQTANE